MAEELGFFPDKEESVEDSGIYETLGKAFQAGKYSTKLLSALYGDVQDLRRRASSGSLAVRLLDTVHDFDYATCTPDLVFVFPHPDFIEQHKGARTQFKQFSEKLFEKVQRGYLKDVVTQLPKPKKNWIELEDWESCLFQRDLVHDEEAKKQFEGDHGITYQYLTEKLRKLSKVGVSACEGEEFKIAVEAGIELLVETLATKNFTLRYFMFGENRLAILATWNDDSLSEYAQRKSYPLRIDAKKLLGDKMQGALVAYNRRTEKYLQEYDEDDDIEQNPQGGSGKLFVSKDRSLLASAFISSTFDLHAWKRIGILKDHYLPHHKRSLVKRLEQQMDWSMQALGKPELLNIHWIHDYFGSQIAYYFAFSQFTCRIATYIFGFTAVASVVRILAPDDFQGVDVGFIVHGFLAGITGAIFLKAWVRHKNYLEASWEHRQPLIHEPLHPEFRGRVEKSKLDSKKKVRAQIPWRRKCGKALSWACTASFCTIVILANYLHFSNRALYVHKAGSGVSTLFDIWLAAQIKMFRFIWQGLAPLTTAFEHHKYEYTYNESMETQLSVVFVVNSIFPFVYVAFVLPMLGHCPKTSEPDAAHCDGCWLSLVSAFRLLIVAEGMSVFGDVLKPVFGYAFRLAWAEGYSNRDVNSFLEYQSRLLDYTGVDLCRDYQQLVIPAFYLFMFGQVAWIFPAMCLWIIAILQRSLDYWKMTRLYRRPNPTEVTRIGKNRLLMLKFFAYFSALTNWALVSVYCKPFKLYDPKDQFIVCICGALVINSVVYGIESNFFIANKNSSTKLTSSQHQYQRNLLINKLAQDHDRTQPRIQECSWRNSVDNARDLLLGDYWEACPFNLEMKWHEAVSPLTSRAPRNLGKDKNGRSEPQEIALVKEGSLEHEATGFIESGSLLAEENVEIGNSGKSFEKSSSLILPIPTRRLSHEVSGSSPLILEAKSTSDNTNGQATLHVESEKTSHVLKGKPDKHARRVEPPAKVTCCFISRKKV